MSEKQKFILGIGAPRSGTTWIYSNLRRVDGLYMSPIKELRYFHNNRSLIERKTAVNRVLSNSESSADDITFANKWLNTTDGDPTAYTDLFPKDRAIGEVSPIYSVMQEDKIALIKDILQAYDVHCFYVMRNPLERDLSHVIFTLHRNAQIYEQRPLQDYQTFIRKPAFIARSDYQRNVYNWRRVFKKSLRLYYFDDLNHRPRKFFSNLCRNMKIECDLSAFSKRPINLSGSKKRFSDILIPPYIVDELRERHLASIPRMNFLPDPIRMSWLEQIENLSTTTS